ncbi:glycosyltransferase family 9 protein [bacterium]|nr:glycosyltransferase family 9 protein [bacterium]
MSFRSIAQALGKRWFLRTAHHEPTLVKLPAQSIRTQRVLVLLPEDELEYRRAVQQKNLTALQSMFPHARLHLIKHKSLLPAAAVPCKEWDQADLDYWGLPSREMKKRLVSQSFDIVLDLSLSLAFINLTLAHHTKAPIKIGFADPLREKIYNFIISFSTPPAWDQAFEVLCRKISGSMATH